MGKSEGKMGKPVQGAVLHTAERYCSSHITTLLISLEALKRVRGSSGYGEMQALVAIVMAAITVEGTCNAVGAKLFEHWDEFDSSKTVAKFRVLANELGITGVDGYADLVASIRWLSALRNEAAHPKAELVTSERLLTQEQYESENNGSARSGMPLSKFEKKLTLANAEKAYQTARSVLDFLVGNTRLSSDLGLAISAWSGGYKACSAEEVQALKKRGVWFSKTKE